MDDSSRSSSQGLREGSVDLGDDLLQETDFFSISTGSGQEGVKPSAGNKSEEDLKSKNISDWAQNARILFSEGFLKDSKKLLHQILIDQPDHSGARELLEKVHKAELDQLLEPNFRRRLARTAHEAGLNLDNPDGVLRGLDQDLQLGLFGDLAGVDASGSSVSDSLSSSESAQIIQELVEANGDASAQDWVDLGIAFLEMELSSIASQLFMHAFSKATLDQGEGSELSRSSICLLALALIHQGKGYEAFFYLQPWVRDFEVRSEDKMELFYLMGRAYELMHKFDLAVDQYQQIMKIDPQYRDVAQRLSGRSKNLS